MNGDLGTNYSIRCLAGRQGWRPEIYGGGDLLEGIWGASRDPGFAKAGEVEGRWFGVTDSLTEGLQSQEAFISDV
jgi:hypothetical protein